MDAKARSKLHLLIIQMLEGDISREDQQHLTKWLTVEPEARASYLDVIEFNNVLQDVGSLTKLIDTDLNDSGQWDNELLNELLELEKLGPTIEIPPVPKKTAPKKNVPQEAKTSEASPQTFPWFWPRVALTSLAALLLLVLAMQIMPKRRPVGTIVDLTTAQWEQPQRPIKQGDTLYSIDKPWHLRQGLVTLAMHCGAEVYVEGPAIFSCKADNKLVLQEGRVCAYVPVKETLFTISTPNSQIVDLGTEFGVHVGGGGISKVQVFEGETEFINKTRGAGKQKQLLNRGMAYRLDNATQQITPAFFEPTAFVRYVDPQSGFVWHGEPIDLADIVGGGDGFHTGIPGAGVSVVTGSTGVYEGQHLFRGSADYVEVSDNPHVDGVFVVCRSDQIISSTGIRMSAGLDTDGTTWGGVILNQIGEMTEQGGVHSNRLLMEKGQLDGVAASPLLCLPVNTGITFDLQAVSDTLSGLALDRFKTLYGSADGGGSANVTILIDGQVVFHPDDNPALDQKTEIDIPLNSGMRFLTLMVTSSQEHIPPVEPTFFVEPRLVLQRVGGVESDI